MGRERCGECTHAVVVCLLSPAAVLCCSIWTKCPTSLLYANKASQRPRSPATVSTHKNLLSLAVPKNSRRAAFWRHFGGGLSHKSMTLMGGEKANSAFGWPSRPRLRSSCSAVLHESCCTIAAVEFLVPESTAMSVTLADASCAAGKSLSRRNTREEKHRSVHTTRTRGKFVGAGKIHDRTSKHATTHSIAHPLRPTPTNNRQNIGTENMRSTHPPSSHTHCTPGALSSLVPTSGTWPQGRCHGPGCLAFCHGPAWLRDSA